MAVYNKKQIKGMKHLYILIGRIGIMRFCLDRL